MNHFRQSRIGRCLNFFAMLAFLLMQVPVAAIAQITESEAGPGKAKTTTTTPVPKGKAVSKAKTATPPAKGKTDSKASPESAPAEAAVIKVTAESVPAEAAPAKVIPQSAPAEAAALQPDTGNADSLGKSFRSFWEKLTRSSTSGNEGGQNGQSGQVGTKVTHDALKFFVPEKRIRLDATVFDPKGVTIVRAYFKSKTQADYVFVPMEPQQTAKDSYVANLPAMSKSNDEVQYLFLVVNGANEVLKTEPFVVKVTDSKDVPSWQMVSDEGSVKLFTEVPDAPTVAASFSDSVSLNVVESGARFGLVAQLYGASGSATASGAAASASNGGITSAAAAGLSTTTIALVAAGVVGVAAGGGGKGGGAPAPAPAPAPVPVPVPVPVPNTSTTGNVTSTSAALCVVDSNTAQDDFYDMFVNNVRIGPVNNPPGGSTCYNVKLNSGSNSVLLKLTTVQCCTTFLTMTANPGNYSSSFGGTNDHSWTIVAP